MSRKRRKPHSLPDWPEQMRVRGVLLNVRVLEHRDVIQFGVEANFDRWANSVDFWAPLPKREGQRERLLERLSEQIAQKNYDQRWGLEVRL